MPAYLSHSIMGEEVYEKALEEKEFKIDLDETQMRSFSIGSDYSFFSKISSYNSHNKDTKAFFINFINYIKENNLRENSTIMALLYGHVSHYFLDLNCHPLVYYNELGLKRVTKIPNHELIEGYISSYLCQNRLHQNIMNIKSNFFSQGNLKDINVKKLLTNVFLRTYNDHNIMISYYKVQKTFALIEKAIKNGIFSLKSLLNISGFEHFLSANNISREELLNLNKKMWTNPLTGEKYFESLMDLYFKSIEETINAINVINKYLYDGAPIQEIEKVFNNLSFDTGVDCSLGHIMKYTRKNNA